MYVHFERLRIDQARGGSAYLQKLQRQRQQSLPLQWRHETFSDLFALQLEKQNCKPQKACTISPKEINFKGEQERSLDSAESTSLARQACEHTGVTASCGHRACCQQWQSCFGASAATRPPVERCKAKLDLIECALFSMEKLAH